MLDDAAVVVTSQSGRYEINKVLQDKLAVLSNGDIFVNENYKTDEEVLNKITFFKNVVKDNGSYFSTREQIKYVTAEDIREYYDENQRLSFFADANAIQKTIVGLITRAYNAKATDIHIVLQAPSTFIYFRVLGDLHLEETLTYDDGNAICNTLYTTMTTTSGINYNPREQQDANISGQFLPDGLSGIRVATGPTQGGNSFMVLRLLPAGQNTKIEDLGYAKSHLRAIRTCKSAHNGGITIFSGPTGSGKSTSLQAVAKETLLDAKGKINFLTIEDPIEYPIMVEDNIEEIVEEHGRKIKKTKKVIYSARQISIQSTDDAEQKSEWYRKTVVAAMRQDPDVIMIGEMRDHSTVAAAITASNTGHPVITTLHARNAQMIIDRLITIGADKNLLLSPDMINGLVSQHLVPELCPNCKRKLIDHVDELDPELIQRLNDTFANHGGLDGIYIRGANINSTGCGYHDKNKGNWCIAGHIDRFVVAEIILPDETYLQYMRDGKMLDAQQYWHNEKHGYTMLTHGLAKVKKGWLDPRSLESKLRQISPQTNLDKAIEDVA